MVELVVKVSFKPSTPWSLWEPSRPLKSLKWVGICLSISNSLNIIVFQEVKAKTSVSKQTIWEKIKQLAETSVTSEKSFAPSNFELEN